MRDTTTNLRQIFEGDINTLSKEVPGVYEEIANFVVENNFFYIDSSKAPPLELLDEFCKEVLEGGETEKATNTNYGYVTLSCAAASALTCRAPGGVVDYYSRDRVGSTQCVYLGYAKLSVWRKF